MSDLITISPRALEEMLSRVVRETTAQVLKEARDMQPLMTEADVCRALKVGRTTLVQKIQPKMPPLFVEGQKRWHPDTVNAYLRSTTRR